MLTTLAFLAILNPPPNQEAMALKLKPGDKVVYELSVQSEMMNVDAVGRMPLSVTKKDGAKLTVSWPKVEFIASRGNFQPLAAGTAMLTDKGRLTVPEAAGQAAFFLVQMALPDAPVAVGGTFKIKDKFGPSPVEWTGKLEKMSEDGAVAVFAFDGQIAAQGGSLELHWVSNFDVKRGIFRSSTMTMTSPQLRKAMSTFGFKLVE